MNTADSPRVRSRSIITARSATAITFRVDDVKIAESRPPLEPLRQQLERAWRSPLLACSQPADFEAVRTPSTHPLVAAVHCAFSEHRPLVLTPDVIWMVIAQGFAHHVNNNAEALRGRFVRHTGKLTLQAETKELSEPEHWADVIDMWSEEICRHVTADFESLLVCSFTTTTPTIRTASQVAIIDAFRQYFDYALMCVCGIPEITVTGTIDDWLDIRARVAALAKYDLEWWASRLLPVCDAFIKTVQGKPSKRFWQAIYKPRKVYGGETITGWLADLFPYLGQYSPSFKNPILSKPRASLRVADGIRTTAFPLGLSQAPFNLKTKDESWPLELVGGFLGVTQAHETMALQPEIGWAVRRQNSLVTLIDALASVYTAGRPDGWAEDDKAASLSGLIAKWRRFPPETRQLTIIMKRFGGGTLFGDGESPWYVRPEDDLRLYSIDNKDPGFIRFMDLIDGRAILHAFIQDQPCIVVGRLVVRRDPGRARPDTWLDAETTVVIAESFEQLLERMQSSKGRYFFDDPGFTADELPRKWPVTLEDFGWFRTYGGVRRSRNKSI
jgi:hypothetical protein